MNKASRVVLCMMLGIILPLLAACNTQTTQEVQQDYNFNLGYNIGYGSGFQEGARIGFNAGRFPLIPGEYESFGDWFYSNYPEYR